MNRLDISIFIYFSIFLHDVFLIRSTSFFKGVISQTLIHSKVDLSLLLQKYPWEYFLFVWKKNIKQYIV